jgi:hypothetical protein
MQRSPDSVALLNAWEAALSQPELARAPWLLVSLGWVASAGALWDSTVGETDRLLFELRTTLLGPHLECVSTCPSCGDTVEFTAATGDIMPVAGAPDPAPVSLRDGALECRLPVNADLHELVAGGGVIDSRRLLGQWLVSGSSALDTMSDSECDNAVDELAAADPGASIELGITCGCSHEWVQEFDIRSFFLAELTDWAVRSLRDVHQIASRYGWSESEILRMSHWRKRIYLEACGAT